MRQTRTTTVAGVPVMHRWRANPRHPNAAPSVGYLTDEMPDENGRAPVRVPGDGPTWNGAEIESVIAPEDWTVEMLEGAEACCEAEYRHAVRLACNPIGGGTKSPESVLHHAMRARDFKTRAWRWGVLAGQKRRGVPMTERHVENLMRTAEQADLLVNVEEDE